MLILLNIIYFIYTIVLNFKIWLTTTKFLIILIKQNFVISLDKRIYIKYFYGKIDFAIGKFDIKLKRTGLTI